MVCGACRTVFADWQQVCPACGKQQRARTAARALQALRRWLRACLLVSAAFIVLATAYLVVSKRLPLSVWTVPLILEALGRVNDHAGALDVLGAPIRVRGLPSGTHRTDETGWREFLLSIPVRGPKSEAMLSVRAGRGSRGPWAYTTLTLEAATSSRVDVLEPPRAGLPPPSGGRRLYLVALGNLERVSLDEVARHYGTRLGLDIHVLPKIDLAASLVDYGRGQLIAEAVVDGLRSRVRHLAFDPSAVVIALTEQDMYIRSLSWRFAFSYRGDERFAVVSAARMAPLAYQYRGKEYVLHARVRKMVGKNIGVLLYRFPLSADPTSLLRGNILSVADLDEMRDSFEGVSASIGASEVRVSHRLPPVEPQITPRATLPGPDASYPCFLARRGVTSPSGTTTISAAIGTCKPGMRTERDYDELEVDLRAGMLVARKTDLFVSDALPLALTRCYRLWDEQPRAFGVGTNHPYDTFPVGSRQPYTYIDVITADGYKVHYDRISKGTGYADAVYEHVSTGTPFYRSRFQWNGNGWDLRLADGSLFVFPESYAARRASEGALIELRDSANRVVRFDRDRRRNLLKLTAPAGGFITFRYDANDRIATATDHEGHSIRYSYDAAGRLVAVTGHAGQTIRYVYDRANLVIVDGGDSASSVHVRYFDARVSELRLAGDRVYRFRFNFDQAGVSSATSAVVTDPLGNITEVDIRTGVARPVASAR